MKDITSDSRNRLSVLEGNYWDGKKTRIGNCRVQVFDNDGKFLPQGPVLLKEHGDKNSPTCLAVESRGNVYVAQPKVGVVAQYRVSLPAGSKAGASALDFKRPDARRYSVESHVWIKEQTGLNGYLFDSFYNLGFMPVSYRDAKPTTMWRELLQAAKQLQDAGVSFLIESFGPFGQPQHGCPPSYSIDRCWVCYKIDLGNDYTTVPSGPTHDDPGAAEAAGLYYVLAHMTCPPMPLFREGVRIDRR